MKRMRLPAPHPRCAVCEHAKAQGRWLSQGRNATCQGFQTTNGGWSNGAGRAADEERCREMEEMQPWRQETWSEGDALAVSRSRSTVDSVPGLGGSTPAAV
ncbi:hypothetical protein PMIN04_004182 [Paraphaeosphaeria minitans]